MRELHQHVRRAACVLVLAKRVLKPEAVLAIALLGFEAVLYDPPEPPPAGDLHRASCVVDVDLVRQAVAVPVVGVDAAIDGLKRV